MPAPNPLAADLDHVLAHTEHLWSDARGARFFITGGTGFVGTWLVESLLWANARLNLGISAVLLTRQPNPFPHLNLSILQSDIADFAFPSGAFPFVIHAATTQMQDLVGQVGNLRRVGNPPAALFDLDVSATRRVLDFAATHNTRRFLFTSSGAVYGKQPPEITHVPEDYRGAPLTTDSDSSYGQAKRVSEFLCCACGPAHGIDPLIARLFAFVGPWLPLDRNFAVGNFIRDVLEGGPIRISGDGTPYRSYLYAADMAIWLWTILFRGKPGRPYNVGSPHELTIAELAQRVASAISPRTAIRIAQEPVPGTPAQRYVPSTRRAESELGVQSWILLEEAIQRTYQWQAPRYAGAGA